MPPRPISLRHFQIPECGRTYPLSRPATRFFNTRMPAASSKSKFNSPFFVRADSGAWLKSWWEIHTLLRPSSCFVHVHSRTLSAKHYFASHELSLCSHLSFTHFSFLSRRFPSRRFRFGSVSTDDMGQEIWTWTKWINSNDKGYEVVNETTLQLDTNTSLVIIYT